MHFLIAMVSSWLLAQAGSADGGAPSRAPASPMGFSTAYNDSSEAPCVDFYQFACGGWKKNNPVPPDQSRWARFTQLAEHNRDVLHQILEKASVPSARRDSVEQKYGDYYASCMDEKSVNAKRLKPLQKELDRIAAVNTRARLVLAIAHLQELSEINSSRFSQTRTRPLFSFSAAQDPHDALHMIAELDQGGWALPDRDYYLKEDSQSLQTRSRYLEHIKAAFQLLGEKPRAAARDAKAVLAIESQLAKASMDKVARRDPINTDHRMTRAQLGALAPHFGFPEYFKATEAPPFAELNVADPDFFKGMDATLESFLLFEWKAYLRWHLLNAVAPLLSRAFVDEEFKFYGQHLKGQKEPLPRWKQCVMLTDAEVGEALGQAYVAAAFGPDAKEQTQRLVRLLESALGQDIGTLPWMTPTTKTRAAEKLAAIANKIGYPEKWRDYGALRIERGDLLGNALRARAFERQRQLHKIGQPTDRSEWRMTPPTVNAYYSAPENSINFPAGILQPPFYDPRLDDAVNLGGIGAVIGHELTHGFDDHGRKFDAQGDLNNWWTDTDAKEFERRAACLVDEYSQFVAVHDPAGDVKLNGRLTLGENTADNGGLRIAYIALQNALAGKPRPAKIDGFTPEQRLFLAFGQLWCENATDESARLQAQTNPHSLGRFRVNGVVQNMPEFQRAFGCSPGQPMVRKEACRVW